MNDIIRKLTSRKFWICVAAFLASVAASVNGMQTGNDRIAAFGLVCGIIAAAIYAAAESAVDASRVSDTKAPEDTEKEN